MSINTPTTEDNLDNDPFSLYEEFEDIVDSDLVCASIEAGSSCDGVEIRENVSEDSLKRDIEKVQKLRVEEVRWFYKSGNKKRWKPFIGCDSIAIEKEWRCVSRSDRDIKPVCVRGGMYEVDVLERKCHPVYWTSLNAKGVEESIAIIRGTWFYEADFMPISESLADRLEAEHMERWKGCSLDEVKTLIKNTVMHSVKLPNCHVDWYTVNDVYLHSDAVSRRALRTLVQRFGASKTTTSGYKLHRGYREDAMNEDCMPPVEHLVFMVHGIGSKPDRQKIVRNTNTFRLTCERVAAKHFAHYTKRVEFLPVEWRSRLVLDNGIVESLMPRTGYTMRQFLNYNAMDIMYYTSPLYRGEIVDGLRQQITRIHGMFVERNPDFHGKISVYAHSLGTVIMHDIMTAWSPEFLFEDYLIKQDEGNMEGNSTTTQSDVNGQLQCELAEIQKAKEKISQMEVKALSRLHPPKGLGFMIENFFCVGSPLAIFLTLRGLRPIDGEGTQDAIVPKSVCKRIFNVYHPADPVVYRFEPLLISHYSGIAPVQIHSNTATRLIPYSEMPTKAYPAAASREMTNISSQQTSSTSKTTPVDICDNEEQLETKESVASYESGPIDDDSSAQPCNLESQDSYLKSISGGAFRVGKVLLGKARGPAIPGPTTSENSFMSEDESEVLPDALTAAEKGGTETQSRLVSQSENIQKQSLELQSYGVSADAVHLEHRLDYELQEGFTERRLGYASLTAHTSYWGNPDVALFVLMQLHPQSALTQDVQL